MHIKKRADSLCGNLPCFFVIMDRFLFDELVDRFPELVYGLHVVFLDCIYDTGRKVFFENDSADGINGGFDRTELYEDIRTVTAVSNHPASRLHMTDDARHPVEHSFGMLL